MKRAAEYVSLLSTNTWVRGAPKCSCRYNTLNFLKMQGVLRQIFGFIIRAILGKMAANTLPKLDRTAFSVVSLEQNDEAEKIYWLSKTPYERLDALETMRQIVYGYDPTTTRLQRFFEVTQRA